jgi:hypothetical protein
MGQDPTPIRVHQMQRDLQAAAERMADEHPLDTLLAEMREHGWDDGDPMVKWVKQAMVIPYPMTRTEAVERGIIPLQDA